MFSIKNQWYAVAWADEVGRTAFCRKVFGENVLLYRKESDGGVVMMNNRCPHKGAPLSLGTLKGDAIACPYHGLEFGPTGRCTHIPSQSVIPPRAAVKVYPCIERYGLVWFWPGDPNQLDESLLLEIEQYNKPEWEVFNGPYTHFSVAIENILDNLVDPAHTTFVHGGTIGGADASEIPLVVEQTDKLIRVGRWIPNSKPVPVMQRYGRFDGLVDRWQQYNLLLPNISLVDMGAIAAGGPRDETILNSQYRTLSYAVLTPETESTTHYFWFVLRCFAVGDQQVSHEMREAYIKTFDEDRVLLGAIQQNTGDMLSSSLRLAIDNASIRLRRALEKMSALEEEVRMVASNSSSHTHKRQSKALGGEQ